MPPEDKEGLEETAVPDFAQFPFTQPSRLFSHWLQLPPEQLMYCVQFPFEQDEPFVQELDLQAELLVQPPFAQEDGLVFLQDCAAVQLPFAQLAAFVQGLDLQAELLVQLPFAQDAPFRRL